ncbi:MAG TPA: hypothetical protein VN823_05075 [Stellaceae bacterium]|nr:hypothetical protein [Stellaceae bacterium]
MLDDPIIRLRMEGAQVQPERVRPSRSRSGHHGDPNLDIRGGMATRAGEKIAKVVNASERAEGSPEQLLAGHQGLMPTGAIRLDKLAWGEVFKPISMMRIRHVR